MRPEERDFAYLWDMLEAARTALEFTRGTTFHDYDGDRKLQLAVERLVEIIGEAARHVSEPFRSSTPTSLGERSWPRGMFSRTTTATSSRTALAPGHGAPARADSAVGAAGPSGP